MIYFKARLKIAWWAFKQGAELDTLRYELLRAGQERNSHTARVAQYLADKYFGTFPYQSKP